MYDRDMIFILHVSDFHLKDTEEENKIAHNALRQLTKTLRDNHIKIEYMIHTGDVIDAKDLHDAVRKTLSDSFSDEDYDKQLYRCTSNRFDCATKVFKELIDNLNLSPNQVIICCGNHDAVRPKAANKTNSYCKLVDGIKPSELSDRTNTYHYYTYDCGLPQIFEPFETFLNNLNVANCKNRNEKSETIVLCELEHINVLIINTNWSVPEKQKNKMYYCVRCDELYNRIKTIHNSNKLNVIIAHKPIYEICEIARLPYDRFVKTPFMAAIQDYIDENGIYLCGDKHTRSIIASSFHDIPHYIGGQPLTYEKNIKEETDKIEVEYNLIEIRNMHAGRVRKIHLSSTNGDDWICELRPPDTLVSSLYELSRKYINKNTFRMLSTTSQLNTWESVCQLLYDWGDEKKSEFLRCMNKHFISTCKYRVQGTEDIIWRDDISIFGFLCDRMKKSVSQSKGNILNIRGEYGSGKSTFLELFYIYLLYQYSQGRLEFIPLYFNLELMDRVETGETYKSATQKMFEQFVYEVDKIIKWEQQPLCFIIDGLDELDCWSYSSEDSAGRGILDVLSKIEDVRYIFSFSQYRLPMFKQTMPARKYNDKSDVMYFNPVDVQEKCANDHRYLDFVTSVLELEQFCKLDSYPNKEETEENSYITNLLNDVDNSVCEVIRKFRRLTIDPSFVHHYFDYITDYNKATGQLVHQRDTFDKVYNFYIDKQHERCMEVLGYGFVNYAPAMAYLFLFKGFTYERFRHISPSTFWGKKISDHSDKIYDAFVLIKKYKDIRDYLVALHYNRELRFYAENCEKIVEQDSILNEYMTRNIALQIRMLWTDTNKFLIVCDKLLNRENLDCQTLSMLIYILAHQHMIYAPFRDELQKRLIEKAMQTLSYDSKSSDEDDDKRWIISGESSVQKRKRFIELGLYHTIETFRYSDYDNSIELVNKIHSNCHFRLYNRQFQMLYYGDLTINGEDRMRALNPGLDIVNKGFDFHNTFKYLSTKLILDKQYPLRDYDLYTLTNIISSRLAPEETDHIRLSDSNLDTFFKREIHREKAISVLEQAINLLEDYLKTFTGSGQYATIQEAPKAFVVYLQQFECYLQKMKSESNSPYQEPQVLAKK